MKRIYLIMIAMLTISVSGLNAQSLSNLASKANEGSALVKDLMKAANVNEKQATGGAGALFEMAQENMSAEDFKGVTEAVPDVDKMMSAASSLTGKKSMLSSAATTLTGMPKVKDTFKKMGISEDKIALFTPVIVNYVEKNGSKVLGQKLSSALNMK